MVNTSLILGPFNNYVKRLEGEERVKRCVAISQKAVAYVIVEQPQIFHFMIPQQIQVVESMLV